MNREAMNQLIMETLSRKLENDFHISIHKNLKVNMELDGLTIRQNGETISPIIYLDSFYGELENGVSINAVTDRILAAWSAARVHAENFDISFVCDFECIKGRLYVALVNRHFNQKLLQDIPHSLFLDDFAVVVQCMLNMPNDTSTSFLVHSSHLKMWQVSSKEIMAIALQNTREMLGVEIVNMADAIKELVPDSASEESSASPIWVLTNRLRFSGAAVALFDDVLSDFAKKHDSFYIIFSSVHEVLLLPISEGTDIDSLTKINQEVNATDTMKNEILGTKAYLYLKDKGFVLPG